MSQIPPRLRHPTPQGKTEPSVELTFAWIPRLPSVQVPGLRALTLVVLLLAATAPAVHGSSSEPTIVQGPANGGYVVVLLGPNQDNRIAAEGRFTIGAKSVYGAIKYAPYDDGNYTVRENQLAISSHTARVQVATPWTATHRQDLRSVPEDQYERSVVETWAYDPIGIIFFATGNVTDIKVIIHQGVLLDVATGPEALAMWMDDLPAGEYHAAASTLLAMSVSAYATSRVETSFSISRPYYGSFLTRNDEIAARVVLEDPTGTAQECPCWLQPTTSIAGHHKLSVEGIMHDTLLYWVVAPEILIYPE